MKLLITTFFILITSLTFSATVKLKLMYRNNPLCHWEVSLKHGDAVIGKGKSDENGEVSFSSVQLLSKSVDASGYKKTANGEKKWDVKGYITLDDNNSATVNFEKIIEETGAPASMMEVAWGLTLNDCSGGSSSSSSTNSNSETSSNSNQSTEQKSEERPEPTLEEKMADMKQEREQNKAEFAAQQEQQKQALEQKLQRLDKKISDAKTERDRHAPGTTEHSTTSYELRDLEIDRELTQLKHDKIIDQQASTNGLLSKSERERYNSKTDALEEEQKQLRKNKKEGILYGQTPAAKNNDESKTGKKNENTIENTDKKDKKEKQDKEEEEDDTPYKIYTPEELANMSTFDLKRTKLSNNQSITKRKTKLKVKAAFYDQAKKKQMQDEIDALTKQVEAIKNVLLQRNEKEDAEAEK